MDDDKKVCTHCGGSVDEETKVCVSCGEPHAGAEDTESDMNDDDSELGLGSDDEMDDDEPDIEKDDED